MKVPNYFSVMNPGGFKHVLKEETKKLKEKEAEHWQFKSTIWRNQNKLDAMTRAEKRWPKHRYKVDYVQAIKDKKTGKVKRVVHYKKR